MALFESSVTIECDAVTVFEFLIRPENLLRVLPPDSGLNYTNVPEQLELGSILEYELHGIGPVQHVKQEVTRFDHPYRFVESQVRGPLKEFEHDHLIEPLDGDGVVTVIDRITFLPPGGMAGFLITEDRIREKFRTGFEHRHQELKRILEEGR